MSDSLYTVHTVIVCFQMALLYDVVMFHCISHTLVDIPDLLSCYVEAAQTYEQKQ